MNGLFNIRGRLKDHAIVKKKKGYHNTRDAPGLRCVAIRTCFSNEVHAWF